MKQKLVRDNIPQIILDDNCLPVFHIAEDKEYWSELKKKLNEEVLEFCESESEEELADVLEVIYAISEYKNFDRKKVNQVCLEKRKKRGGFSKKIILESFGTKI